MKLRKFSDSKKENKFVFINGKKNIKLKMKAKHWLKKPLVKKRLNMNFINKRNGKVVFSAVRNHFGEIYADFLKLRASKIILYRKFLSERIETHIAGFADKEFFFRSSEEKWEKSKLQIQSKEI